MTGSGNLLGDASAFVSATSPAVAAAEEGVTITIQGEGFSPEIEWVRAGEATATRFTWVNSSTITAEFGPLGPDLLGPQTVTVRFKNGVEVSQADGLRVLRKQDPVVFVHGCPLPRSVNGSVTNYVTSKYWHKLYNQLRDAGYRAPPWKEQDDFLDESNYDHPATHPARDNYLNVFVLSEDDRRREHTEVSKPNIGGHCGSAYTLARELNAFIDQVLEKTGAERVDLVVNSAGALGSRLFLLQHVQGLEKRAKVRDVVFLAGMAHGSEIALVPTVRDSLEGTPAYLSELGSPNYDGAREGSPAYDCLGLNSNLQREINNCGEGPGKELPLDYRQAGTRGISYLSIYNATVDELIQPTSSACIYQRFPGDCSDAEINVAVHAFDADRPEDGPHQAIRGDNGVLALAACFIQRRSHRQRDPAASDDNCLEERLAVNAPF